MTTVPFLLLLASMIVFIIMVVHASAGQALLSPAKLRRHHRIRLTFVLLLLFLVFLAAVCAGKNPFGFRLSPSRSDILVALVVVAMVFRSAWIACRPITQSDLDRWYALEPRYCPRCEYDLTGNAVGACSECGWDIPKEPVPQDMAPVWFLQWRIDNLRNWKRTFARTLGQSLLLVGLTGELLRCNSKPLPMLLVFICGLYTAVDTIRVAQYGWRQGIHLRQSLEFERQREDK